MTKFTIALVVASAGLGASLGLPAPAIAQSSDKVSEIVVYGEDPCPRSTDDQVVVCARRPETERYRIAPKYRSSGPRQTRDSWANRAQQIETVGNTGPNTCSPVGPANFTGCLTQVIREARQQRREGDAEDTPPSK